MARSEHLPGVEVAITVDGNDLKEYECDEPSSTPRTTTKYVEATTDKCFEVRVKVDRGFKFAGDGLSASVAVDGVHVEALRINEFNAVICVGERKGQGRWENGQLRRYQFAGIEIGEGMRPQRHDAH